MRLLHSSIVKKILFTVVGLLTSLFVSAQHTPQVDTTQVYAIPEFTVTERYSSSEVRSTSPLQILSSDKLQQLNVLQVSDAIKHFSGVTVKDYGGVGGLKTVSVRSLGANHTAVNYDGIPVSDLQTGQIDIGRFSLDNVEMVSLSNGQSDNIFQPARVFASASVLNIRTKKPEFNAGKNVSARAAMKIGSFGLVNPTINLSGKISRNFSATLGGEYMSTNGEYPYILSYGSNDDDLKTTEKRKNSDVENLRLEGALYGRFSEKDNINVKAYYYQTERGLPGSVILYNPSENYKQRVWDKTFFAQAHYQRDFSELFSFQLNGKYNWTWMRYLDSGYLGSEGKQENIYSQQEYYISAALLYRILENFSLSVSSDGFVNTMYADYENFVYPQRYSWLSALALKYVNNKVLATASVLYTFVNESVKQGEAAGNHRRFSPYASASVKPFDNHDFRIRAFYKNIFRLPTFNDLYYNTVGSSTLKPENTNQYNIGLTYAGVVGKYIPYFMMAVDAFHNDIDDKIVALPRKDISSWSMVNYGKVAVNGLELTAEAKIHPSNDINFVVGASHTYQRALVVTSEYDRDYKNQIPYTPRVSGSAKAGFESKWINVFYSLIWSGHRYIFSQNYAKNRLPGYSDHSISVSREFSTSFGDFLISGEALNLADKNYMIVYGYPMPGRSFRASLLFKF
ncbi:TonB-dependent receptor [Paludibacter sp. 221]|uniref:TonB-dependent receptor plug domain-containing protein n=1 Tax=Paludibacter sp. 221 TaxID=2302939 RepID=UPI0013D0D846|nr:TonB-dependent receptor plug domain-containing protein [Paludibacter sp. 221]NDV47334.1 TonB-dependent receptor [Paludibacter sp. 221]